MVPRSTFETPAGEIGLSRQHGEHAAEGSPPILQMIAELFPSPTLGQTFTRRFLERAAGERSSIPDVRAGDHVICVKSIALLGQELGLSNDTTNKYVLLFKALGLLEKRKIPGGLAFVLSLGIYHPPLTLEANLDYLITRCARQKSRGKFHRLVLDVKERCQTHGLIAQDLRSGLEILSTLLRVDSQGGSSPRKLERRVMQAQRLVSTLITQLRENPRPLSTTRVDSSSRMLSSPRTDLDKSLAAQEERQPLDGPPVASPVLGQERPYHLQHAPNLPQSTAGEDGGLHVHQDKATHYLQLGRRDKTLARKNLPELPKKEDPGTVAQSATPAQIGSSGRFRSTVPPERLAETTKKEDSGEDANVNVITIIEKITLNVEIVALFCCKALGEDSTTKRGIYSKLFRDIGYDARVITAALIYVLVHRREGTMRNPAAVFHKRCTDYYEQGVPDEVAALVEEYGALPYAQLVKTLERPAPVHSAPPSSRAPRASVPGQSTGAVQQLPPIPTLTTRLPTRIALREGHGLTFEGARKLFGTISDDLRIRLFGKGVAQLSDGSYAVLVDNTVESRIQQVAFYSSEEWQACSSTMRCGADLFGRGEHSSKRRPRPAFLLQKGAH